MSVNYLFACPYAYASICPLCIFEKCMNVCINPNYTHMFLSIFKQVRVEVGNIQPKKEHYNSDFYAIFHDRKVCKVMNRVWPNFINMFWSIKSRFQNNLEIFCHKKGGL